MDNPFARAKEAGYNDEEIMSFLDKSPKYKDKINLARQSGYSNDEIFNFLSNPQEQEVQKDEQRGPLAKAARVGSQVALGAAEKFAIPYELAAAPLASTATQQPQYRESLFEDIQNLQEQKARGDFKESDQQLLDHLLEQVRNPSASEQFLKPSDISVRGLAEKATGIDFNPQGSLEKAGNWLGFIRKPTNVKALLKSGSSPKSLMKAIMPSGIEVARSLGAGTALELAEQGNYGPIGTIGAAIVGDLAGGGTAALAKAASTPKQSLAKLAAKSIRSSKKEIQKDLIRDMREAGIQADIGTITDSEFVKMLQTKLSQSGLTGDALDKFRDNLLNDVKKQYTSVADGLGRARFESLREASVVGKEYLVEARNAEKEVLDELYSRARSAIKPNESAKASGVSAVIDEILTDLKPGKVKSTEQKAVIRVLNDIKKDISRGKAEVDALLNTKTALNDVINFEVQGGQKKLLKRVTHEIDKALTAHGSENKQFADLYQKANSKFKKHAETFRNDVVNKILTSENPELVMQKMNTIEGMKQIEKALSTTGPGRRTFKELQRLKLDQMIGDKMTDNVTLQLKTGTFANLLKNPKDKQLVKEMLGPQSFARLERLQKATGILANTAQKFFNASKSGSTLADWSAIGALFTSAGMLLTGNPWGIFVPATVLSSRATTRLISDPKFLKMVEDVVLASKKGDQAKMLELGLKLLPAINAAKNQKEKS